MTITRIRVTCVPKIKKKRPRVITRTILQSIKFYEIHLSISHNGCHVQTIAFNNLPNNAHGRVGIRVFFLRKSHFNDFLRNLLEFLNGLLTCFQILTTSSLFWHAINMDKFHNNYLQNILLFAILGEVIFAQKKKRPYVAIRSFVSNDVC
nr:MAG TPA: hypothetical protein [Caudoviricetes sp.]